MKVEPATAAELDAVRAVYADGRALQREHASAVWPEFSDAVILAEISEGCLLRVGDDGVLRGDFSMADSDEAIWGEHQRGAHIYLHRIARVAGHDTRGFLDAVLTWAEARCTLLGRDGLRMDTWAGNTALVLYYETKGFSLVGQRRIGIDARLAAHYHGLDLALLERRCGTRA